VCVSSRGGTEGRPGALSAGPFADSCCPLTPQIPHTHPPTHTQHPPRCCHSFAAVSAAAAQLAPKPTLDSRLSSMLQVRSSVLRQRASARAGDLKAAVRESR
jgi:hypothetical protein